jgi:threonyl-tRNA synthetase
LLAVGQREIDEKTVALRRLGSKHQKVLALSDAILELSEEIRDRGQAA